MDDVEEYLVSGIQPEQIRWLDAGSIVMLKRVRTYLSFVRFSHSVFALPFALAGALLAARHATVTWSDCRLDSRRDGRGASAAMGFNRLVDAASTR